MLCCAGTLVVLATHDWSAQCSHPSLWLSGGSSDGGCASQGSNNDCDAEALTAQMRRSVSSILGDEFSSMAESNTALVQVLWCHSRQMSVQLVDCLFWQRQ